jgi:hypothetical protein
MIRARWHDGVEEWRKIPSAPGYSVSSFGRVRRDAGLDHLGRKVPTAGKCLTARIINARSGHYGVSLSCDGKKLDRLVHRLVAEAFLGDQPTDYPFVCHIDGNPQNNCADNLYWGSGTTNAEDRTRHGRTLRGDGVGNSKLSESDARSVLVAVRAGESQRSIASRLGISQGNVSMISTGKTWGHIQ